MPKLTESERIYYQQTAAQAHNSASVQVDSPDRAEVEELDGAGAWVSAMVWVTRAEMEQLAAEREKCAPSAVCCDASEHCAKCGSPIMGPGVMQGLCSEVSCSNGRRRA